MDIALRPVSLNDSELVLKWRNSASARKVSQSDREIDEAEHWEWFNSRISRISLEPYWMTTFEGNRVGFVRLDFSDNLFDIFTVSIFVDSEFRNLGIGKRMLKLSLASVSSENKNHEFRAVIRNDNVGSIKLFETFGFRNFTELNEDFCEYRRKSLSDAPNL